MGDILEILKHDLHKIKTPGYLPHDVALKNDAMVESDKISARMSRNWMKFTIEDPSPFRKSFIDFGRKLISRTQRNKIQSELSILFKETNPIKLHSLILKSRALNQYTESMEHVFSSLKYHLLLACALYYNYKQGYKWNQLYLTENGNVNSPYEIIFKSPTREWTLSPNPQSGKLSPVRLLFSNCWDIRLLPSIGGENKILSHLLSCIGSWSAALATIEEFFEE